MKTFSQYITEAIVFKRPVQLFDYMKAHKQIDSVSLAKALNDILSVQHPLVHIGVDRVAFANGLVLEFKNNGHDDVVQGMKYTDDMEMHPDKLKQLKNVWWSGNVKK